VSTERKHLTGLTTQLNSVACMRGAEWLHRPGARNTVADWTAAHTREKSGLVKRIVHYARLSRWNETRCSIGPVSRCVSTQCSYSRITTTAAEAAVLSAESTLSALH